MIFMDTIRSYFNTVSLSKLQYSNKRPAKGHLIEYGRLLNFFKFTWVCIREQRLKETARLFESSQ